MFTNYDQLARLKIEEFEMHARQTSLQRQARAARERYRLAEADDDDRSYFLMRIITPISHVVLAATRALRAVAR